MNENYCIHGTAGPFGEPNPCKLCRDDEQEDGVCETCGGSRLVTRTKIHKHGGEQSRGPCPDCTGKRQPGPAFGVSVCGGSGEIVHPHSAYDEMVGESRYLITPCPGCPDCGPADDEPAASRSDLEGVLRELVAADDDMERAGARGPQSYVTASSRLKMAFAAARQALNQIDREDQT